MVYAGFWKRLCAYYIDAYIITIISYISVLALMLFFSGLNGLSFSEFTDNNETNGFFIGVFLLIPFILIVTWLYFAFMEMSPAQGTLGKMDLGIIVTDERFERVTFGRATGRFFGRILSGMILYIGFLMIPFTSKKQGLHDKMAKTYVVDKKVLLLAKQFGLDVHQPPFVQYPTYSAYTPEQPPLAPFGKE
ncbi:hypothetical protein BBD42_01120 [Paenibacillus sp. BIHB 4019]|uniref:RDD domain-containing protein n=1 Tax=Paenibacillus sp. BIHB 4019 TaxID=1870819 RepID=A0A1B2DC02_9BACL|nr:RDD family protein [Paenibacillus sp. BIHB 4019]ANY65232.1 hypothetical protein BBD42_01120 [Paenibacillus sp. BIHB 4019]